MGASLISETAAAVPTIAETYKGRDVEGLADVWLYRPLGYWVARFFALCGFTPIGVTLLGALFGLIAGRLYFYPDVALNLLGLVFHVVANLFDNADGQLARLTNRSSRAGRLVDSVCDQLIWVNIYLNLGLRLHQAGWSSIVWLLVGLTLASHGLQAAAADYCRNAYLYFVAGRNDMDTSRRIRRDYASLTWSRDFGAKFFLTFYLGATRQQEILAPSVHRLHRAIEQSEAVPRWLSADYQARMRPLLRGWSLEMTNTRMVLLLVVFLLRQPALFLWLELIGFNLLLVGLLLGQDYIARTFLSRLDTVGD